MKNFILIATTLALGACAAQPSVQSADPMDFEPLLSGWWDEGPAADSALFCGPDRNLHRHAFSADGQSITWSFEEPSKTEGWDDYTYRIVAADSVSLTLELQGEDRTDENGDLYVWQLVIVDEEFFRWRATSFPTGVYNPVIGKWCRNAVAKGKKW